MKNKFLFIVSLAFILLSCSNEPDEERPFVMFSYTQDDLWVTFENKTRDAQSYLWDFGDGYTSTAKSPKHVYASYGKYKVTLTAKNITKTSSSTENIELIEVIPQAAFTYKTSHPLKVNLTNNSTNATSYLWTFGDGKTSTEKDPIHQYSAIGVYRVTLKAQRGKKVSVYEQNVTIEAPTTCIYSGAVFNKIPNNNYYYQIQITDDYVFSKTTYSYTNWFLLSSANIPYELTFNNPKTLSISNSYVLRLYKSSSKSSGQASGKGFWTATVSSSKLKTFPESLTYSDATASITLKFQWR